MTDTTQEQTPRHDVGWSLPRWPFLRPAQWRLGRWFLLAVAAGVLLMTAGNWFSGGTAVDPPPAGPTAGGLDPGGDGWSMGQAESRLAALLTDRLSRVDGAGRVAVLVTLDTAEEHVFAEDADRTVRRTEESDPQGGRRQITETDERVQVLWQGGMAGGREPLRLTTKGPRVRGVLVVAPGARDAAVRHHLLRAVQVLLDVPPHRIAIIPGGEER